MQQDMIVILDLGSTENTVLARAVRDLGVYSEIYPHDITPDELRALPNVRGILLNGGPNRVVDGAPVDVDPVVYSLGIPTLSADHPTARGEALPHWPKDPAALTELLRGFVFDTCKAQANWNMENFIADQIELVRKQVGSRKVLLALSGGVDSSVVAALLLRAIGDQLTCVHVNHGLLRKGEPEQVVRVFRDELGANLVYVDASERFLGKLAGVADPEQKRKIIGAEFIRVFEEEARKVGDEVDFLAQGTIYPDILESKDGVKAHHNVGGLPEDLQFDLVEPVKLLYKDEVRVVGRELGLPENMVERQPFPGPGLGVRCLGAITRDRLEALREADAIVREEMEAAGVGAWQYFAVVPDMRATGVRDGVRAYEWPAIIRAINTVDVMTATVPELDWELLKRMTDRITHEVPGICRVCYDLTPKPVGTVEWE